MALPDYSEGSNISIAGSNAGAMGTLMQLGKNRRVKYIKEGISTVHETKGVKTRRQSSHKVGTNRQLKVKKDSCYLN